ncbi:MAG: zf-HC2 domain-containing protein [Acidobacteria bacterium]|nr:zf-HC2 domain-containing protein [Acidobacteriota bacterium]
MKCREVRELMPDLALGLAEASREAGEHLRTCMECGGKLEELRKTMALLDQWQAPEVSPYFDTRLKARVREEKTKAAAGGFWRWMRKPALALATTLLLVAGLTWFRGDFGGQQVAEAPVYVTAQPGTPVGDLQTLDRNHDLLSNFDVLDDLAVQQDVNANP